MNDPVNLFVLHLCSMAGVYGLAHLAFHANNNNWAVGGWMFLSVLFLHVYGYLYHRRAVLNSVK